mmetsp:Transcript_11253/g.26372  ORF Transcript_11253/g.26372 Transcript_11253/m.26372 type:complete len:269 (+) Transcript_11253:651-1457(+)
MRSTAFASTEGSKGPFTHTFSPFSGALPFRSSSSTYGSCGSHPSRSTEANSHSGETTGVPRSRPSATRKVRCLWLVMMCVGEDLGSLTTLKPLKPALCPRPASTAATVPRVSLSSSMPEVASRSSVPSSKPPAAASVLRGLASALALALPPLGCGPSLVAGRFLPAAAAGRAGSGEPFAAARFVGLEALGCASGFAPFLPDLGLGVGEAGSAALPGEEGEASILLKLASAPEPGRVCRAAPACFLAAGALGRSAEVLRTASGAREVSG